MSLADIFQEIESARHDTIVNLASGLRVFKELLQESESVPALIEYIGDNPQEKYRVQERIQELLLQDIDPTFVHPLDTAIASYLFVLNKTDNVLAFELALQLVRARNLWWSNLLANDVTTTMKQNAISVVFGIRYKDTSSAQSTVRKLPENAPLHRELITRAS
jgi:hypothetical protein